MNQTTKDDFLKIVKLHYLEVFTQDQFIKNASILKSFTEKSLRSELSQEEKTQSNLLIEELGSLQKWEVLNDDFTKSILYTRREQVKWDEGGVEKGEWGEILKARSGTYKNTPENKKLGRIGQKYGSKKEEGGSGKGEKKGKELGKTKSGKSVHLGLEASDYKDFTTEDHRDAAVMYYKEQRNAAGVKTDAKYRAGKESHMKAGKVKDHAELHSHMKGGEKKETLKVGDKVKFNINEEKDLEGVILSLFEDKTGSAGSEPGNKATIKPTSKAKYGQYAINIDRLERKEREEKGNYEEGYLATLTSPEKESFQVFYDSREQFKEETKNFKERGYTISEPVKTKRKLPNIKGNNPAFRGSGK